MKTAAIIFLWVIHLSALIGIGLGYADFFFPKSPLTMLYILGLFIWQYPVSGRVAWGVFLTCFLTGMVAEWIGVHSGVLFGDYYYGDNFGPKIDGIPLLIGANWAILTFVTHQLVVSRIRQRILGAAAGAGLMVLLDYFLEQICSLAGFWYFSGGAGWYNYVCWFVIGWLLHLLLRRYAIRGDERVSLHIYTVQLVFAAVLWALVSWVTV